MDNMKKQVISMLVSSDKLSLFTIHGEIIEIKNDGEYNITKISEFLAPKLSGQNSVEIDLSQFQLISSIIPSDFEGEGIVVTQIIDGREVQGIFYPRKVAVEVTVGEKKITIPDVENLTGHIKRAAQEKSPSVANFLKRLAPVLDARKHSGEDLMQFIKQSEMPLTNDGRIIAYKRVKSGTEAGFFADCHTGKVNQRVGSRVTMKVDLVDSSRHNSCSTGLHVANLGYMQGFYGTATLIVLVNPEDFIAVPKGELTKARVCAYEVIGVLSPNAHKTVNEGTHVSNDEQLKELIKKAVEGRHVQPFEEIEVGNYGKIVSRKKLAITKPNTPIKSESSGKSLNEDKPEQIVRDAVEATRKVKGSLIKEKLPTEIKEIFDKLIAGKSKTQVADAFFTSTRSIGRWMEKWDFDTYKAEKLASKLKSPVKPEPKKKEEKKVNNEAFAKSISSSKFPKSVTKVEQARKLYNNWILSGKKPEDLKALKLFKSSSKKSWDVLGITATEVLKIQEAE